MRYLLAFLSHGDTKESRHMGMETADSFADMVAPRPYMTVAHHDGPGSTPYLPPPGVEIVRTDSERLRGFCGASRWLWAHAAAVADANGCGSVFWLEHDFRFDVPIDLTWPGLMLDEHRRLAQMSLMRQPLGSELPGIVPEADRVEHDGWFEHRAYFTTNPSLMRTRFMRANQWPDYPEKCEGRFGVDLRERGYSFGVWGDGSPWVTHIGEMRTGKGY